jgi:pyruvate formate lyase activating enzyme
LQTLVYERLISRHIDPIEKKPLYHVLPGSMSYSVATAGCNFRCVWCQNWEISQLPRERAEPIPGAHVTPDDLVSDAVDSGCHSLAYTYTEPTIFFEYAMETARRACSQGVLNIFVTNGYMTPSALWILAPYLHAANVDLKAFRPTTYARKIGGRLQAVLDSLKLAVRLGIWIEVTTLIIPGINDCADELTDLATFIAEELGTETPWHLSAFYPSYRMLTHPPTPRRTLRDAWEIGKSAGLHHVYVGNVPGETGQDTICSSCGAALIGRRGFQVVFKRIRAGHCPDCGEPVAGIWWEAARNPRR